MPIRPIAYIFHKTILFSFLLNLFFTPFAVALDSVNIGDVPPLKNVWGNSQCVFAVGNSGTIISSVTYWQPMPTGVSDDLYDVWGSSDDDVYAVGGQTSGVGGKVLHYDGTSWSVVLSTYSRLRGVWGSSATDVFVVGEGGEAWHYDGSTWTNWRNFVGEPIDGTGWQDDWSDWDFTGIWGDSATNIQVIGGSYVLQYDGTSWSTMPGQINWANGIWENLIVGPLGQYHQNVSGTWLTHSTSVYPNGIWQDYAIGNGGGNAILFFNGSDWAVHTALPGYGLGIHGGAGIIYAAGYDGEAGNYTGALWRGLGSGYSTPTTTASPDSGAFSGGLVTLTADSNTVGVSIQATYYTTDGSTPTEASTSYTSAIQIDGTTTLKFFSVDEAGTTESVQTKIYSVAAGTAYNDPKAQGGSRDNPSTAFSSSRPQNMVGLPGYTVNTSTLNLSLQGLLFQAGTRGAAMLHAEIYYNSDPSVLPRNFGNSWRFFYEASLEALSDNHTILYQKGSGQVLKFASTVELGRATDATPITLTPPEGHSETLTRYTNHCTLLEKTTRLTYRFDKSSGDLYYLTSITDPNGNVITVNTELTTGKLLSIVDSASRTLSFTYADNRCSRISVPGGRNIDFSYNATTGDLTRIVDVESNTADFIYDADHYLTRSVCEGHRTDFTYESRGTDAGKYVSRVQDNLVGITDYEFLSTTPRQVRVTSPTGKRTTFNSSDLQTNSVVNPLGVNRQIGYTNHKVTRITDGNNKATTYEYDSYGNVSKEYDAYNKATSYTYDANHKPLTKKNALNQTWTYTYDANGNLKTSRTPLLHTTSMAYDSYGQMLSSTNPLGQITSWTYDQYGNVLTITNPAGDITRFDYSSDGLRCIKMTDADGNVKDLEHDYYGRLTKVTYGTSIFVQNEFNAFYQTTRTDENGQQTTQTRNSALSVTQTTQPLGNVQKWEYNTDNLMTKSFDGNNNVTSYLYDDDNRLTRTTDPLTYTVSREYDDDGNLIRLTDQRSNATTHQYDDNNRLSSVTYPSGTSYNVSRDYLGRIIQKNNGRGQIIGFSFDNDGRRAGKTFSGVSAASYTYDAAGNMLSMTDPSGTTTYTYNSRGKVASITWPNSTQVQFNYTSTGQIATLTYPDGMVLTYSHEARNRSKIPASLRMGASFEIEGSEPSRRITGMNWDSRQLDLTYDNGSRLSSITRPNGTSTLLSMDNNDRLSGIDHRQGVTSFLTLGYGFDNADHTISSTTTGTIYPVSSLTTTGAYNSSNQITTWADDACTYDADGNLTGKGTIFTASYNAENQPTTITVNGITRTYLYNANGLRVQKTENGVETNYHYDHKNRLLFESNDTGTVTVCYLYNKNTPMAFGLAGSGFHYYHYSRMGNTVAISDDVGAISTTYSYLPYGQYSMEGDELNNPFTYVGAHGVMDAGDDLFYMKNRFYDADSRHFLQRDPIGFKGGVNLYLYTSANPVDYIDPQGTCSWTHRLLGWCSAAADGDRLKASQANVKEMTAKVKAIATEANGRTKTAEDDKRIKRGWERVDRLKKIVQEDIEDSDDSVKKFVNDTGNAIMKGAVKTVVATGVVATVGATGVTVEVIKTSVEVVAEILTGDE